MFFRQLSPKEENEFRQWARDNYQPDSDISGAWHPVVQEECVKINRENAVLEEEALKGTCFDPDR